ncbi:MAG: hypothetical protein LIP02_08725 [Bacteroidales bacterium]|nr:hypothetical protein [Bacteroidales bacterium]
MRRQPDPIDRAVANAVTLICAALTAFAVVACLPSCHASRKATEATQTARTDTTAADRQQSWQRIAEVVAQWEADSAVLDFGAVPQPSPDTCAGDGTAIAHPARLTLYHPKAKATARDSVTANASESLSKTTSETAATQSETAIQTRAFDLWGLIAGIAIAVLALPLIQKLIKLFRNGL